jgi:hypothetical protein
MKRNRDPDCLALACAVLTAYVASATADISLRTRQERVGRYERIELSIEVSREYENPFDPCEVKVDTLIVDPHGRSHVLPAFWGQDYERQDLVQSGKAVTWCYPKGTGSWKARFAPMEVGTHTARAVLQDRQGEWSSEQVRFESTASSCKGFLRTARDDPRFLEFSEGQPFFAIGQNLAFIGEGQYVTVPKAEQIFRKLAANGANFVRVWTCCQDWALAIEARKSAWGRSWAGRLPIVPVPGSEGESPPRKCVRIEGASGASLAAEPSHNVALRPATRYVLSGKTRTAGVRALRVEVLGNRWDLPASGEWQRFEREFAPGENGRWLGRIVFSLVGEGTAWLDSLSLRETAGGPELLWEADVNRPSRGYYNPLDCFLLDQIVEAAQRNGVHIMLCAITRDLYMDSLSNVDSPEYRKATHDAKKFMRYAVARWGCSTSVAAWEYFNEMDPGKPTDRFYAELGDYLATIDPYHHPRTTSTWAPSARDCRHAQLDIAQEHHYMRPDDGDFKDEVESIVRQSGWLREHAPAKPALIGEFGLADAKWGLSDYMKQDREGVHFHNCLWASALSGVSGTAMFWWWEVLDQQDLYRHYKPLAEFLAELRPGGLRPAAVTTSEPRLRIVGQQTDDRAHLWLVDRQATWWNLVVEKRRPDPIASATVTVEGLGPGEYAIVWWDTQEGVAAARQIVSSENGRLTATAPPFVWDLACKIVATPTSAATPDEN